jgi:pimeloyl-ACP methyl ester carboxylesterase
VALPGAKASFGTLGNTVYQIEMPNAWNGELVMYAHGFAGFGTEVAVDPPPRALREQFVAQGYAWAASSFSENGYTPGIGADDTLALKQYFEQQFGKAKRVYLAGASMGGNVVTLSLEHYGDQYDGALAACGAVGGEEIIDYLMSWTALAEYTSGVPFPIGEGSAKMTPVLLQEVPKALGSPDAPTQKGKAFASAVKNLTGGPRPFFAEGFKEQYVVNFGLLLLDPDRKTLPGRAATNEGVTYDVDDTLGITDAQLNAGIRRLKADPEARSASAHPDAVPTTGKITKPLLTIHGTGDLFVPITQERSYRQKVDAVGKGDLLVQRAIRAGGHCKFSDAEYTAAFNDLVAWVKDGKKPAGDDLRGDLTDIGKQFTNPLRAGDPGGR